VKLHAVLRALRTFRHLLPEQALAQGLHLLGGRVTPVRLPGQAPNLRVRESASAFLPAPAHARGDGRRLEFINREIEFPDRVDWDFASEGPLWSFHLHQFDWLRQPQLSPALRTSMLLDWCDRHPQGIGWRPHPICLRILSWGKLLLCEGALELDDESSQRIRYSLACQAETLARNPERRLQANHLLSNYIGVVFAGLLFDGPHAEAWLARADALRRQLDRQVGADGSHVERSPMYHSLLLENLLDLLNLARALESQGSSSSAVQALAASLADDLAACTARMLGALDVWTHPDGEIALFSDSAHGIAHPPAVLREYASSLGVATAGPRRAGLLQDSGFAKLAAGPFSLIASLAGPMPAYMPGHAHCDALAFELSVLGERVVTDTGVGSYIPGPERDLCRTTRSHATLQVDGIEQAELWSAHRIGGRPEVVLHAADPPRSLEGSCVSWGAGGALHRRIFEFDSGSDSESDSGSLAIRDTLEGGPRPVRIAFPLAPGLVPEITRESDSCTRVRIPLGRAEEGALLEGELTCDATSGGSGRALRWTVENATYFPEFGKRVERSVLVGTSDAFTGGRWCFRVVGNAAS